jgi:DNA repair exonuclease SbcCD ATPase subunit
MKEIKIKEMHLINFKGVRELQIKFNDGMTTICGRNGSGKTTILDAFTWLLFGKDSQDRKQFNIKTLDENSVPIPQLPHEVSAILLVDGKEVRLCRRYKEIWRRRQGRAVTEFDGHDEERLYDDVPLKVKDWQDKINAIVEESVFKFITIPSYFPTRKPEVQREMLFNMAGRITDEEIARGNEQHTALLKALDGRTMAEYKLAVSAKKNRLKDEAKGIPDRIDERKRSMPQEEDWDKLQSDLEGFEHELADIDKQIGDITETHRANDKRRRDMSNHLSDLEKQRDKRKYEIESEVSKDYYKALQKESDHKSDIRTKEAERDRLIEERDEQQKVIDGCQQTRENLVAEWKEIKAKKLEFDPNAFICPTCKRELDADDIERKREELTENFNQSKANELAENQQKGKANKEKMEKAEAKKKEMDEQIAKLTDEITKMQSVTFATVEEPDATDAIANDAKIKELDAEIEKAKADLEADTNTEDQDTEALQQRKSEINTEISDIKIRLAKREDIEKDNKRIAELEEQLRKLNSEIAEQEGIEMQMLEFSKARAAAIESRVNGMFKMVRFKMFDTLVNGTELETCVATVDGVPYDDGLNNAKCINAGIDIINAICAHIGVRAPIFIDNAESVNEIIPTESQLVRLVVSNDKQLTIS